MKVIRIRLILKELKKSENTEILNEIKEIETKMMTKKDWTLKGEVTSRERPKNSLLENYLDFQVTLKNPPIPTRELTDEIEKIIISRIKDEMYDNPTKKKVAYVNKSKNIDLKFSKSKEGLGQLYENDYMGENANTVTKEEDIKIKSEIDMHMTELFNTLDKLSSFHFIPRNANKNVNITNVQAIQLEEFSYAASNVTNNKTPSELYNQKDAVIVTKNEMNKDEKSTSHNKWKRNIRNRIRAKENLKKMEKMNSFYNSKFETKMAMKQMKDKQNFKYNKSKEQKSSNFFSNIQNIAETELKEKKKGKRE